jgi:hypothetical protein
LRGVVGVGVGVGVAAVHRQRFGVGVGVGVAAVHRGSVHGVAARSRRERRASNFNCSLSSRRWTPISR